MQTDKTGLKIFLACAFGAGLGATVALSLGKWLWWIGMIIGGLAGYLSYEFKRVLIATKEACQNAEWKISWDFIKITFASFIFIANIMIPFIALGFIPADPRAKISQACGSYILAMIILWTGLSLILSLICYREDYAKEFTNFCWKYNPARVYFYEWPLCMARLIKKIPKFLQIFLGVFVTIMSFCKQVFILIHSDIRLLCGLDAAIGAGIGYWADNAIIGAIAGGIWGLLNYEILSKRVFKLVSTK